MTRVDTMPSRLLLQPSRLASLASQKRLSEAQTEAATGRHHDIGLALGSATGSGIGLRLQLAEAEQGLQEAKAAGTKAQAVQGSLSSLTKLADGFRSMLAGARTSENGRAIAASSARSSLDQLRDTLSVTYDGQYLFGGLNSESAPLKDYAGGPRQAVVAAFQSTFGFAPDDPAAAALTPADIKSFLDGPYSTLFSGTGWTTSWSNAADETPKFRLGSGQEVDLSTTANAPFAQSLAKAFTAMEVFGQSKLNASAFQAAADHALATVSEASLGIGSEQARIGIGEARLKQAQDGMEQSRTSLTSAVQSLEGVDPYEAATRVNLLMSQLESSYALTGRISRMSLLSYI